MMLCGRAERGEECVYLAVKKMVDKMKEEVAERQSIAYTEQMVVAKIYDITAAVLSEACRRNFGIGRKNCEPSKGFKSKHLTLDTFILLNQLKEDGFITDGYKQAIFDALIKIKPEIEKLIDEDKSRGLI